MSLSITTYPQLYVIFARSGVKYTVKTTSDMTLGTYAVFTLVFTSFPVEDDQIKIVWGEHDLTFTFKDSPDTSGLQLNSTMDLLENMVYFIRLGFLENFFIYNNFTISQGIGAHTDKLYFLARNRGDDDITITYPIGSHVSTSGLADGTNDTFLSNFRIFAAVNISELLLGGPDYYPVFHAQDDADGYADIDFADYIRSYINPLPTMMGAGDIILERHDIVVTFSVQFAESYGDPATVQAMIASCAHEVICIKGGVGSQRLAILNDDSSSIFTLLESRKQFLTWLPKNLLTDRTMPLSLFYLSFTTATSIKVKITLYYSNGNTWTSTANTITGTTKYNVYEVNANIDSLLSLLSPPSYPPGQHIVIYKYKIWLEDQNGNVLSDYRTFTIDYSRPRCRYFKYLNSLGTFDVIRTTGNFDKSRKFEAQMVRATLPFTIDKLDFQKARKNVFMAEMFSASTGFCNVNSQDFADMSEMMAELFLSEEVYEYTPNGLVPVIITSSEYLVSSDDDNMRAVAFEYEKTYDDQLFSDIIDGGTNFGGGGYLGSGFGLGFLQFDPNNNPL